MMKPSKPIPKAAADLLRLVKEGKATIEDVAAAVDALLAQEPIEIIANLPTNGTNRKP